jgi:hypothetical protein
MSKIAKARRALTQSVQFESGLTPSQHEGVRREVQEGIRDIAQGHYQDYDEGGLRALAKKLVAASAGTSGRPPRER